MPNILIVDCFDSFTYNLFHYLDDLNQGKVDVLRYDEFSIEAAKTYSHLIFSPGPGLPEDYPLILEYLRSATADQSILGVCLGHQSIGLAFGAKLKQLQSVKHGQKLCVSHDNDSFLFDEIDSSFESGHYHSWVINNEGFPNQVLKVTSTSSEGFIMSVEHLSLPIYGVQFHPESIMTTQGIRMLKNYLQKEF